VGLLSEVTRGEGEKPLYKYEEYKKIKMYYNIEKYSYLGFQRNDILLGLVG